MTPLKIQTVSVGGANHYAVKFGDHIRTVLPDPLTYKGANDADVTVPDGSYTICYVEEVLGSTTGDVTVENVQMQILVNDVCTSDYTNRGGNADGKGDGATEDEWSGTHFRYANKNACDAKCGDPNKAKWITGGNPEVIIPDGFDTTSLSYIDISSLSTDTEIVNINAERTHDSSWLLKKDLDTCQDANGAEFPDPAGLAYTDLSSTGRGKYNLDKPIFAKLPGPKWALHDFRTEFVENSLASPLEDGGGAAMKRAARGVTEIDLNTRCSNVQRNVFNDGHCRVSYHPDACLTNPIQDPNDPYKVGMLDPTSFASMDTRRNIKNVERASKYLPAWAGPDGGGVIGELCDHLSSKLTTYWLSHLLFLFVVCGSDNEVAPIPTEDDHFDVTNRKLQADTIDYDGQKKTVWLETVLGAQDQLCQRLAFGLSKIFATSVYSQSDASNSETNIAVYDDFVNNCFSTYRDVMKKVSFNEEMASQCKFSCAF
jgi:hypothetical protein